MKPEILGMQKWVLEEIKILGRKKQNEIYKMTDKGMTHEIFQGILMHWKRNL